MAKKPVKKDFFDKLDIEVFRHIDVSYGRPVLYLASRWMQIPMSIAQNEK